MVNFLWVKALQWLAPLPKLGRVAFRSSPSGLVAFAPGMVKMRISLA